MSFAVSDKVLKESSAMGCVVSGSFDWPDKVPGQVVFLPRLLTGAALLTAG